MRRTLIIRPAQLETLRGFLDTLAVRDPRETRLSQYGTGTLRVSALADSGWWRASITKAGELVDVEGGKPVPTVEGGFVPRRARQLADDPAIRAQHGSTDGDAAA